MAFIPPSEIASFEAVLQEFNGLTNEQAYLHVFSQRMMQPVSGRLGEYMGCDQRIDMMPTLQNLVKRVPENGQIFDVGAGAGDVVDFALKNVAKGTIINIEDPNPALLEEYLKKLDAYQLKRGIAYKGPLQDYYQGTQLKKPPQTPQNLILAIHMIYHLTDFTQPEIDPQKDLIDAFSFLYSLLAPGGSMFIVYADLLETPKGAAVCSVAEKYFRHYHPNEPYADNLISIYQARNQLFGPQGSIATILTQRYPHTHPSLHSVRNITHFFGKSVTDIAVLGLATELCPSNNAKFDITKLQFCLDYVLQHPNQIGLQKEESDVPQKKLWRANEPQVLAIITKESI